MKTSNKILYTAVAVTLLALIGMWVHLHREYTSTKAYSQQLFRQLSDTPIRTLIVENAPGIQLSSQPASSIQIIRFSTVPTPETAIIRGDTLVIRAMKSVTFRLPHLENYSKDGVPQPLPGK